MGCGGEEGEEEEEGDDEFVSRRAGWVRWGKIWVGGAEWRGEGVVESSIVGDHE